ncbi:MAG: hypothetical protein ACE5K0_08965 [Candidatus Methanofastidiosia archaeon]
MSRLLLDKLKEFKGKKLSILVEGNDVFTGILREYDSDILVLSDVVDYQGNKGKELMVALSNVLWIMLEVNSKYK